MQPIRLTIPGDFWDSQIYRGRLYLWDMDNSLRVYDWERLIDSLIDKNNKLPITCAFSRSDYLYRGDWSLVFSDADFKKVLVSKFEQVANEKNCC
jgi:hypothetical protein